LTGGAQVVRESYRFVDASRGCRPAEERSAEKRRQRLRDLLWSILL
jgi:hypothetical protein